jgi:tetratricopeptide (TPR) repeat protein
MTILQARFLRCAPKESCGEVIDTLEGFERRFPKNRPLWLEAMDLRLACYEELKLIDASKEQILYLSQEYPVDEIVWGFLGEWAERTDEKAKGLRDKGNRALGDAHADLSLAIYTEMSVIASEQARFGQYLDAVQIRMAEILFALDQTERAGQIYEEVLTRTPDSAEALYQLGRIYEGQDRWDAALEVWRKYSNGIESGSQPWFECRFRIARAHSRMDRAGEACEVITMIRVLHPEIGNAELEEKLRNLEKEVCKKGD